ncbi:SDR family NAD(P)-dependent oxidoreductase [candidate division KSB1 bacterium]|nr:SDR family NAD(P)-dependent oxidoreductase [candidate division KSB1 bacterium]
MKDKSPGGLSELETISPINSDAGGSSDFNLVAIIGGGTMGQGIAQTMAAKGIEVVLVEKNHSSLQQAVKNLNETLDREIMRWAMTKSDKKAILSRIENTVNLEEVEKCDIVISAINEDLNSKKQLFSRLDKICPPETIFVTNTSTLSVTELANSTTRESKFIGMHFLNPVPKIPLVEVVRGLKTSDETFLKIKRFAEQLDKTAVEVFEYPGYVTTRIIIALLNEAIHILMEGVASADGIDQAMKLGFNFPIGPLALADQMGLDEVMTWMESLFHDLGDLKYRPCPLLRKMVRAGHLGVKTGRGFFRYDEHGKRIR